MKKTFSAIIAFFTICTTLVVYAEGIIPVYIDGEELSFDVHPQIIEGRTLVPMRYIFEKFGATVDYEGETASILVAFKDAHESEAIMFMGVGNEHVFVNRKKISLDVPPIVIDGRTLVPVRFISETLGYDVSWNENERAVYIETQKEENKK